MTVGTLTPLVRFTPCARFDPDHEDPELCAGCGWSADDHDAAGAEHDLAA